MRETTYHITGVPRIALLSDLHNRESSPIFDSLQAHKLDMIFIAGDFIYGTWPEDNQSPLETQENVLPFFRACASLAPTFMSLGNHEKMLDSTDLAAITATGVTVLDNSWVEKDGVVIAGLTSGYVTDYRRFRATQGGAERYPKKEDLSGIGGAVTASQHRPETAWLEEFAAASPNSTHILMSHHPEYLPLVPDAVDLVLSGHAHGGQVRLFNPIKREWRGLWSPGQGFFPRWTRGVYERNRLVVSAGLSNTARVPRICNPCEIVYLESP